MNVPNNHCIKKYQKGVLQKYLELCYSTILKVELHCSKILKLIIFVYSPFSDSFSHFVSLLIPLSTTASLSHHISLSRWAILAWVVGPAWVVGLAWRWDWAVKSAWYGGDFRVFLGTFSGFMGMWWRGTVVCGGVFMGFWCGLQRRDRFVVGFA